MRTLTDWNRNDWLKWMTFLIDYDWLNILNTFFEIWLVKNMWLTKRKQFWLKNIWLIQNNLLTKLMTDIKKNNLLTKLMNDWNNYDINYSCQLLSLTKIRQIIWLLDWLKKILNPNWPDKSSRDLLKTNIKKQHRDLSEEDETKRPETRDRRP